MDLKQLTPTQLAVGAGLLVVLVVLLLLLLLLGRSRSKARRRRQRTEAALSDAPTAALAAPPTEPTPTQPPAFPLPPGAVRPPPGPGAAPPAAADQPGGSGLTMFGSTPQSRGPYRVVQSPGAPNQPRAVEPYPNDRLAAEQQRHRYPAPPQPRVAPEPTFDQPDQSRPRDAAAGSPPDSPADRPTEAAPDSPAPVDHTPEPEPEPTTAPSAHPERNGLTAVPQPPPGGDQTGGDQTNGTAGDGTEGDAKDRLLRVLLADPDRALHAVGDLEASRSQLDRLNDSVQHQQRQLADAARRLRGAGLTPAQVAQLAGFGEGELVTLLAEHTPSPTPRPSGPPPRP
jgi:hypothetical protein